VPEGGDAARAGGGVGSLPARLAGTLRVVAELPRALAFAQRSAEAVARARDARIREVVEHAYRTVPFYADAMRARGMCPADVRDPAGLASLPLVERRDIQREPERFLSRARPKDAHLPLRTGGSSGAPCVVYHDPRSVLENVAHGERHRVFLRALAGKMRPRVLAIASPRGSEEELRAFVRRHALVPGRVAVAGRTLLSMADQPERVARAVRDLRPDVVFSYGSYLERLAQLLEDGAPAGGRGALPRAFVYGGDAMSAAARTRIQRCLGIRVWSTYQAVEALKIAFECTLARGLHVHADLCDVRIVDRDGRDVPDGETGDVVVSNLVNRGTVLLNYRLGDVSALVRGPCPCGSPLPLLAFPAGRLEDWLETPLGERVYSQRLRAIFTDEAEV
jgi:phenylacetate-CoA ligase